MNAPFGSKHLGDSDFLRAFEQGRLSPTDFHHADHVRLAWICVTEWGPREAEVRLLDGIRNMAERAGAPEKFLYTTTVAWVRLVAARCQESPESICFDDWITKFPELLNKDFLKNFYSAARLESPEARGSWHEPDQKPLG